MMAEDLEVGGYSGGVASELVDVEDATSNDNTNDDGPRGVIGKDNNATKTFFDREIRDGYDLTWSGINVSLNEKKSQHNDKDKENDKDNGSPHEKDHKRKMSKSPVPKRMILDEVWGYAKAGETTAIMGASGAGKTSLFGVLSGRLRSKGAIKVEADIRLSGQPIDPASDAKIRSLFAFVEQEDALHTPSTPREALRFSARLRLPKSVGDAEIDSFVDRYIKELGLSSCADTMIGGGLKKGISGGEKRRTSIGVELISKPSVILLDEPTSGLDSFAAKQVMALLDKVAAGGATVLFTIHQPSSSVFGSFDRLMMLNRGRLMYEGATARTPEDFSQLGYAPPNNYNPADWIVEVAQSFPVKELETAGFFPEEPHDLLQTSGEVHPPKRTDHVSMLTEFQLLMARQKTSLIKAPAPMIINVCLTGFLAIVFGIIFYNIGNQDRSSLLVVQGQLGATVNILISTMMGQSQTALVVFSSEKPLFLREYATNHYSVIPYFLSHLFTEAIQSFCAVFVQAMVVYWMIGFQMHFHLFLAITYALSMTSTAVSVLLGALVTNMKSASALFTLVVVPQFFFSGVFIATNLIPSWVRWAQYLCSLKYASGLAIIYEFGNCTEGLSAQNCNDLLEQNNVSTSDAAAYWMAMVGLFVVFRVAALWALRNKARNFS